MVQLITLIVGLIEMYHLYINNYIGYLTVLCIMMILVLIDYINNILTIEYEPTPTFVFNKIKFTLNHDSEEKIMSNIFNSFQLSTNVVVNKELRNKEVVSTNENISTQDSQIEIDASKPQELAPTKLNKTAFTESIFIDNVKELSPFKEKVYKTIIKYFTQHCTSIGIVNLLLSNIAYIDVIPEADSITLYCKELNLSKRYGFDNDELTKYLMDELKISGDIFIEPFFITSIYEYFKSNQ